jgi:uncharacterized protein (TIGR03118 family)
MSLLSRSIQPLAVCTAVAGLAFGVPTTASAATPAGHHSSAFTVQQVNLVSDRPGMAALTDPDLVNSWGLTLGPTTPLWSANNGTNTSTLYSNAPGTATAAKNAAIRVTFPAADDEPTGVVFNGGTGFVEDPTKPTSTARFMFATMSGTITAWSPAADPLMGNVRTMRTTPGASYTGLTLATATAGDQLYAADFAQGKIDVFSSTFMPVQEPFGAFRDFFLPRLFHPFNVQALGGHIFVAYAKIDPKTGNEIHRRGLGIVDEFTVDGKFVSRVATGQSLDAPWGLVIAPASFGPLAGSLLIGNFGDGRINVVQPNSSGGFHHFIVGQVRDAMGKTLVIPGLWAMIPGTATTGGTDALLFSSGPDDEAHGLVGVLRKA